MQGDGKYGDGLTMEQRIARIEQRLRGGGIPAGSAPPDGSVVTSDISQVGGSTWIPPQYHTIDIATARYPAGIGTTGFFLCRDGTVLYGSTSGVSKAAFYLDPADMPDGSLDLYVKLDAWAITEANPADSTLTVTLNQVTGVNIGTITSVGSAVCTATLAPNAANTGYQGESIDAAFPAAALYVIRFAHSVDPGQSMTYGYRLQARIA